VYKTRSHKELLQEIALWHDELGNLKTADRNSRKSDASFIKPIQVSLQVGRVRLLYSRHRYEYAARFLTRDAHDVFTGSKL
jgi:hypothetical protein